MATGLSEERARDLIVQGFLKLDEQQMPEAMRVEVKAMVAAAKSGGCELKVRSGSASDRHPTDRSTIVANGS